MALTLSGGGQGGVFTLRGGSFGGSFTTSTAPIDSDAQAFFSRVTTAGGTLSATEQSSITTLVTSLKSAGIWTLMKAIYPMVGASAAACAQNLKSSSFTGTFSGAWTFASTGVTSNGATYMDTNFNNQGNWTSTSNGSMGLISATNQSAAVCDMGSAPNVLSGANSSTIYANYSGTYYGGINCTVVTPGAANASSIGLFVTSRLTTSAYSIYKRGSSTINLTTTDAVGTNPNLTIHLGAGNGGGPSYSSKRYNFCFIGDGLTEAQVDSYWTLLQTFNTSLGR
jgi:hypothetical protein